jgi:hypothetical protein
LIPPAEFPVPYLRIALGTEPGTVRPLSKTINFRANLAIKEIAHAHQGINFQIPHCISLDARLSPSLRPGCGHRYDETPADLVVYVRNDPVNLVISIT